MNATWSEALDPNSTKLACKRLSTTCHSSNSCRLLQVTTNSLSLWINTETMPHPACTEVQAKMIKANHLLTWCPQEWTFSNCWWLRIRTEACSNCKEISIDGKVAPTEEPKTTTFQDSHGSPIKCHWWEIRTIREAGETMAFITSSFISKTEWTPTDRDWNAQMKDQWVKVYVYCMKNGSDILYIPTLLHCSANKKL